VNLGVNRGFADARAFLAELPALPPAGTPGVPSLAGAAQLVQGPSIVVAMPISADTGSAPSRGWLITVRALDADQWHRFEQRAGVAANILYPAAPDSPADSGAARRNPFAPIIRVDGSRIHGLLAVPDLEGKPFRVFSVTLAAPALAAKPPAPLPSGRRWPWFALAAIFAGIAGVGIKGRRGQRPLAEAARVNAPEPPSQVPSPLPPVEPDYPSGSTVAHIVTDSAAVRWEELRLRLSKMNPVFHYQAQIDLQTGRVAGVEAQLFSVDCADKRSILDFVTEVEAAGLGIVLAKRWINDACRNQQLWLKHVGHAFPVGVPVSLRTLEDPDFLPFLRRILAEYELAHQFLELEIPEAVFGGSAAAFRAIANVHAAGISIAIDRFNAARSSLRLLTLVPVAKLRIDPVLVRKIGSGAREAALFDGIIGAARGLGISVCATGVDSPDLVTAIVQHGRPLAQGDALGPIISGEEFLEFLRGSISETASLPPLEVDDVLAEPSGTADGN